MVKELEKLDRMIIIFVQEIKRYLIRAETKGKQVYQSQCKKIAHRVECYKQQSYKIILIRIDTKLKTILIC